MTKPTVSPTGTVLPTKEKDEVPFESESLETCLQVGRQTRGPQTQKPGHGHLKMMSLFQNLFENPTWGFHTSGPRKPSSFRRFPMDLV